MKVPQLSVVIVTFNEEQRIRDCMMSLRWAEEIVVVDDCSTDRTVEICREYTEKVFQHRHVGDNWDLNKNVGMEKASGEWCLLIDADERCPDELREEVFRVIESNPPHNAFFIPRKECYFGIHFAHAFSTAQVLRLIRRGCARFEGDHLHEHPAVHGEIGRLQNSLEHYPYETIEDFITKTNMYTNNEARHLFQQGLRPGWREVVWLPFKYFVYRFWRLRGYKDGIAGLIVCLLMAFYAFLQFAKLWELWQRRD